MNQGITFKSVSNCAYDNLVHCVFGATNLPVSSEVGAILFHVGPLFYFISFIILYYLVLFAF